MQSRGWRACLALCLAACGCAEDAPVSTATGAVVADVAADVHADVGADVGADVAIDIAWDASSGVGASPCALAGDVPTPAGVVLQPVFANMAINQPIFLGPWGDGSDRLFVVERTGRLLRIDNQPDAATTPLTVLDVGGQINTAGEGGLLSAAMHPNFVQNRKIYVSLTTGTPMHSQIREYVLGPDDVAQTATQRVVIDVPQPQWTNHKGGMIAFDKAGFLLYGLGDGGAANDPLGNGQKTDVLLAKVLRIDPDHPEIGLGYGIPADNPFVGQPAFRPEIWTWGMRNPWRFSVDRLTGDVWAGDVGQDVWEEVDHLLPGHNYGWNTMEATHCFPPTTTTCVQSGLTLPRAEYKHTVGKSITGGYVYRGQKQPSLYGRYLFADYDQGKIFRLPDDPASVEPVLLAKATFQPVSFGEDAHGELYVMQLYGALGKIFRIAEAPPAQPPTPLPPTLSATHCFADLHTLAPAPGVLPYEVNTPLWSDGAHKSRFLVPPTGVTLPLLPTPSDDVAGWDLPLGTLAIKHFALGDAHTPVETRFMRRDADGWKFVTYRWRADGSDADLQPAGGGEVAWPIVQNGVPTTQTWRYPTSTDCTTCHHAAGAFSGQVLGIQTAQLDRAGTWLGQAVPNQLDAWAHVGLIPAGVHATRPLPQLETLTGLDPLPDHAQVSTWARAALHANCSHCHRPGGSAPTTLDLRFSTPLDATHTCGQPAQNGAVAGKTTLLAPHGPAAESVLWQRITSVPGGGTFMPAVGVTVPQPGLAALMAAWIDGMVDCAE